MIPRKSAITSSKHSNWSDGPLSSLIYSPLKMVMFHGDVSLPQAILGVFRVPEVTAQLAAARPAKRIDCVGLGNSWCHVLT